MKRLKGKKENKRKQSPKCCVVLSSNTDMDRKEKILVGCEVLYTRLAGRLSRSQRVNVLFRRLGLDVVREPCLGSGAVRVSHCFGPIKQGNRSEEKWKLTRPSKIPVPSVATLGATYHSLSFSLVNWSCWVISSGLKSATQLG